MYTALFFSPSLCVFFFFFALNFCSVLLSFSSISPAFLPLFSGFFSVVLAYVFSPFFLLRLCLFAYVSFLLFVPRVLFSFCFFCSLPFVAFFSALPFIEPESFKSSPVFAGLLFKSRTGSWAGDVVYDLLQISCWIGFLRAKRKGWWTVLPNGAVCVLGNGYFSLWPLNIIKSTIGILISNN